MPESADHHLRKWLRSRPHLRSRRFPGSVRRALVVLAIVALLPVVAMQAWIYYSWYQVRISEELKMQQEIARAVASSFESFARDIMRQEYALGTAITSLQPFSAAQANTFLTQSAGLYAAVSSFQWVSPEGMILACSDPRFIGINVSDRQYFKDILAGKQVAISNLLRARASSEPVVFIARAMRDEAGTLAGATLAAINTEALGISAIIVDPPKDGFLALFDLEGNVVFHKPPLPLSSPNWKQSDPLLAQGLSGKDVTGTTVSPFDRRDSVTACIFIPVLGWATEASRPQSSMLYPIRKTLFFNIGMLLVVMAASFTLAAGITRMIIRALDKLKGHAQALGQGRMGHRTEVSGFSELSELAESFNQMAAQLQERRLAEEKALAELTRANQELDAFAYSTSHDLRGPLRSIDGFSQALLEDYHDKLDDEGKDYLQRVRASSQRMGHLIDDLLKLSRVTRARMRAERVDLTKLAEGITEELARNEPGRGVEFVIGGGLTAEGDESLLRIVLQNLLENAWKFTRNRAQSKVEFGIAKLENGPAYFVRDNGAGFSMAYSNKLFGAFQRLHSSSEFPGTGIGLATVQRIIHRHGGRIWAEGEVGKGATFYFTLNSDSARS